jgi:16S rRNA (cytosine1402-N4)-methyltransferase
MDAYEHTPVLLNEVIRILDPKPGQNFIDATLGGGGYTSAIIEKIKPDGKVLAIDLDKDAIDSFKRQEASDKNLVTHHGNFAYLDKAAKEHGFPAPDGIVADIGLSSYQLDQSGRGISFQKKEILDMRFDQSYVQEDAKFILNEYDVNRLTKIFRDYGEEKFSWQIAKKILEARSKKQEVRYTTDLYQLIVDALPKPVKHRSDDSARRIFQALRIAVNHELENLEEFLPKAFDLLSPGGKLVVVSFHSLEDRIVKQFFVGLNKGCVCPPDFPQCVCGRNPKGKLITKKPITASEEELRVNPRAKPAKLRAILKI